MTLFATLLTRIRRVVSSRGPAIGLPRSHSFLDDDLLPGTRFD